MDKSEHGQRIIIKSVVRVAIIPFPLNFAHLAGFTKSTLSLSLSLSLSLYIYIYVYIYIYIYMCVCVYIKNKLP